jgi:hypothetical protein
MADRSGAPRAAAVPEAARTTTDATPSVLTRQERRDLALLVLERSWRRRRRRRR